MTSRSVGQYGGVLELSINFRDFVGAKKIEDLTEFKSFFRRSIQITSKLVSGEKFGG